MHLPTLVERLNNPHMTDIEKTVRKTHIEFIKSIKTSDTMHLLSVSCGDGIWDYLSAISNPAIKNITATDIVDNPVRSSDQAFLLSVVSWKFQKVMPESPLPFDNESFDIVMHHDVIEHTYKPYLFLEEQFRVLKKGGFLLLGTPNLFRPANLAKLLLGKLTFPIKIGYYEEIGDYIHIQEFHQQQLSLMLQEIGFSIVTIRHCYWGIFPLRIKFSDFPKSQLGKSLCHYLFFLCQKPL
jgi:2-polyprenyl-3-methyl-5-hydroxy-6-metoxy-1,4-benzoquinol methylase